MGETTASPAARPRPRRWARVAFVRVVVPCLAAALLTWLIVTVAGQGGGHDIPVRNLLLPPFVVVVLWNALVTIASAYVAREAKRNQEVDHGV